jgi:hypothetical protein
LTSARGEDNREMEAGRWKMEAIKRREMIEGRREKKKKGCSTVALGSVLSVPLW